MAAQPGVAIERRQLGVVGALRAAWRLLRCGGAADSATATATAEASEIQKRHAARGRLTPGQGQKLLYLPLAAADA